MPLPIARLLALTLIALVMAACAGDEAVAPTAPPPTEPARTVTPDTTGPVAPTEQPTAGPNSTSPAPSEPVASTAEIPTEELPRVRFLTVAGDQVELPIEVPPSSEYTIGLSGRWELGERGMLFYYPSGDHTGSFWMRNTHVDLDIAFVDAGFEVLAVLRMHAETLDLHNPDRPYLAAIEAPAGWYEERDIGPGARVEFLFDVAEYHE